MDYIDLDSFRSRYSDITVTAVPAKRESNRLQQEDQEVSEANESPLDLTPTPRVEIIPIGQQHQRAKGVQLGRHSHDSIAYANEYNQVLAKLEFTKYVQAQLHLMSFNKNMAANMTDANINNNNNNNNNSSIVDAYEKLLGVIAEIHSNLGPTLIGIRAPKERLLRDIAHARVLVRECILVLMQDQVTSASTSDSA
ncbi:CG15142 [Drosophila busckii]|uniref:CG15142 n=1 Tax=Drosophila busckii TaxID=30019 RepID=A0A0M5J8V0_DROBS|nr:formin-C [Drosophila busckii]ALC38668.1 CG15142 [Drosophila busckii]